MAYICPRNSRCSGCPHYRRDEDRERMACWAQFDNKQCEKLWDELADIPFDEDKNGELILAEPWHIFEKGTPREDIWHWFDVVYDGGVVALMFGGDNK